MERRTSQMRLEPAVHLEKLPVSCGPDGIFRKGAKPVDIIENPISLHYTEMWGVFLITLFFG